MSSRADGGKLQRAQAERMSVYFIVPSPDMFNRPSSPASDAGESGGEAHADAVGPARHEGDSASFSSSAAPRPALFQRACPPPPGWTAPSPASWSESASCSAARCTAAALALRSSTSCRRKLASASRRATESASASVRKPASSCAANFSATASELTIFPSPPASAPTRATGPPPPPPLSASLPLRHAATALANSACSASSSSAPPSSAPPAVPVAVPLSVAVSVALELPHGLCHCPSSVRSLGVGP
mmetsp:Transcript_42881/g.115392  ORF Transcript_42881/g.115392 Transcript_42881/m.115392 type:complete len:246 (+) Transcript_42881:438-1175(+)